jgi:hypothetical protein
MRPRLFLSAAATALCLSLSVLCAGASALVTEVAGNRVGVQPREMARYTEGLSKFDGENGTVVGNPTAANFENAAGNPVLHSANTYLIYWDPQWFYHDDWANLIDGFMEHAATAGSQLASVFAVDGQYMDSTNKPAANHLNYLGAIHDSNPYPEEPGCVDPRPFELTTPQSAPLLKGLSVCLSPTQIREQIELVISQHDWPRGMGTVYYLLTPPGISVCLDGGGGTGHCSESKGTISEVQTEEAKKKEAESKHEAFVESEAYKSYKNSFCSYHGAIGSGATAVLYGVIPWTAGGAGDYHLAVPDEQPAYDCQDGAFDPPSHPDTEVLEKEKEKPKTAREEQEYEEKDSKEKLIEKEDEVLHLKGPHQEEPNQLASNRSEDGTYDLGLADLIVNQIAVEEQDIVTDPLLNAWHDGEGKELTDECRNFFAPRLGGSPTPIPETLAGTLSNQLLAGKEYYLNDAFNLAGIELNYPGIPCLSGIRVTPKFTPPVPVNAGEPVSLNGMESTVDLDWAYHFGSGAPTATYPTFTWDFGDGSPTVTGYGPASPGGNSTEDIPCAAPWLSPCAGSVFHTYKYGGTYVATLTVTDVAGNTAVVSHPITVVGPPPPHKEEGSGKTEGSGKSESSNNSSSSSSSSSNSSNSSQQPTPTPTPAPAPVPAPVAAAAIASHSLSSTLKKGLVVRYSVNEQVAGHFEVLLSATIAHHLGISGSPASGLPAGTPAELVIAKAILVTTQGGRNSVDIQFSKRTAGRLSRLHKVTLLLQLIVRNAASKNPATTTVLSPITLTG